MSPTMAPGSLVQAHRFGPKPELRVRQIPSSLSAS